MNRNLLILMLMAVVLSLVACAAYADEDVGSYVFDYPRTSEHVILEYRHEGGFAIARWVDGQIVHNSRAFLRIYGDGKLQAHHPEHSKTAGDHFLQLTEGEIHELLGFLADRGVFDLKNHTSSKELEQIRTGGIDAGKMILTIKLDLFERLPTTGKSFAEKQSGAAPPLRKAEKLDLQITLEAVQGSAEANPADQRLQDLAAVDKELLGILFQAGGKSNEN
ncbi:MAG: hypothetical protein HC897_09470 [Thermoanaerobaculia bacterium]|nr:hypothetical protein [Thermoanaerobaculia bacterium]